MGRHRQERYAIRLEEKEQRHNIRSAFRLQIREARADRRRQRQALRSQRPWHQHAFFRILLALLAIGMLFHPAFVFLGVIGAIVLFAVVSRTLGPRSATHQGQPGALASSQPTATDIPALASGPTCMAPGCDRPATRQSHDGPWVWCEACAGKEDVALS